MSIKKLGRNDLCHCGSGKKYKKCCLNKIAPMEVQSKPQRIKITKELFISKPYSPCPNCKENSFGLQMMGISKDRATKECFKCGHTATIPLPSIHKKIIYLDQFAIDNIVKTLDPDHPRHEAVSKDPFWLQLYEKLDVLSKAHLIVCPDSFYHVDESAPTNYFESMQRIYEHLSGGVTFFREPQIIEEQICEHFENTLNGEPDKDLTLDPEDIVFGNLYEWHQPLRVSINGKKKKEQVAELIRDKTKNYESFVAVFRRWQTEKDKTFEEFYKEELKGFAQGTILAVKNYYERYVNVPEKFLQTGQVDLNDVFPPPSVELVKKLEGIAMSHGAKNHEEAFEQVGSYLFSIYLDQIPALRIGTAIYAALAFQAANGRINLPSQGVKTDVDMISSLLPYCDAMLIDKENVDILYGNNKVKKKIGFPTKIFAPKDREEFLNYLDSILRSADPEHMALIKEIYGDSIEPYTDILKHHKINN